MFRKFARTEILEVKSAAQRVVDARLDKFSDFDDYKTDDGFMYVRVRAISSRVNKNHDGWPAEELKKAYRTFIGKPIFVDHHNSDPKKARGVVVDAAIHTDDERHLSALDSYYASAPANHLPPTWIELLLEVDAKRFPKLAKAIIDGDIDGVSMGCNVERSICSHCGNTAYSPQEYCKHITSKGAYFDYKLPDGTKISKRSYEDCYDIGFFELSFVFDPADETAGIRGDIMKAAKVAAIYAEGGEKTATPLNKGFGLGNPGVAGSPQQGAPISTPQQEKDWMNSKTPGPPPVNLQAQPQMMQMAPREPQMQQGALPAQQAPANGMAPGMGNMPDGAAAQPFQPNIDGSLWENLNPQQPEDENWNYASRQAGFGDKFDSFMDYAKMPNGSHEDYTASFYRTADNDPPQSEMTTAPDKVDTLRQDQICPICGSDMEDGVCEVCNYEEPPEGFDNPDLQKAKDVDKQMRQQDAEQAVQGQDMNQNPQATPVSPDQGAPAPTPGGPPMITSKADRSASLSSEQKISAAPRGTRINTQERPILPAARQVTDEPRKVKTVKDSKQPVRSSVNQKENMTQTQKVADGATALGEGVQAEKRVDVQGVGGTSGDPLSGIEQENVEKNTGDFTAPHTDTWSDGEGDSLGQQDPVTTEVFDPGPDGGNAVGVSSPPGVRSSVEKTADGDKATDPAGEELGGGGSAQEGVRPESPSDAGFPDHDPSRVDLLADLKEEVGDPTKTWGSDDFHVTAPVTHGQSGNDLGGPIGVAVASAKARVFKAMKVAEAEVDLGLIDVDAKFDRVAELENTEEAALDATLESYSKVKTAGLKKTAAVQQKTAGRMPSFKPVTASIDIEANSVSDDAFADSLY